jgi:hypothetical protein
MDETHPELMVAQPDAKPTIKDNPKTEIPLSNEEPTKKQEQKKTANDYDEDFES